MSRCLRVRTKQKMQLLKITGPYSTGCRQTKRHNRVVFLPVLPRLKDEKFKQDRRPVKLKLSCSHIQTLTCSRIQLIYFDLIKFVPVLLNRNDFLLEKFVKEKYIYPSERRFLINHKTRSLFLKYESQFSRKLYFAVPLPLLLVISCHL